MSRSKETDPLISARAKEQIQQDEVIIYNGKDELLESYLPFFSMVLLVQYRYEYYIKAVDIEERAVKSVKL